MQPILVVSVFFGIPTLLLVIGTIVNGGCICDIEIPHKLKDFIERKIQKRHIIPDEVTEHILQA